MSRLVSTGLLVFLAGCAADDANTATPSTVSGPTIRLEATFSGAVNSQLSTLHPVDATSGCRSASLPALHQSTPTGIVETPPGPPSYTVSAAQGGDSVSVNVEPYGLGAASFNRAGVWAETGGERWMLSSQDTKSSAHVSVAADGMSGAFEASGLLRITPCGPVDINGPRLDIKGRWRCYGAAF